MYVEHARMYASIPGTAGTLENAPDHLSLGNMENDTRIPREERNSCSPENTDTISPSRITTRNLSEVNGNGDAIQTESIDVSKNSTVSTYTVCSLYCWDVFLWLQRRVQQFGRHLSFYHKSLK